MIEEFILAINPDDFIGQSSNVARYQEHIRAIIGKRDVPHLVLIEGHGGTGRTSLLRKAMGIAQFERINTIEVKSPINPEKIHELFNNIKISLDELKLNWRSFMEKARGISVKLLPALNHEDLTPQKIEQFSNIYNLEIPRIATKLKEKRQKLIIHIDNGERIYHAGLTELFQLFIDSARILREKQLPIYYVIVIDEETYNELQEKTDLKEKDYLYLETQPFEYADAELFLRRRSGLLKKEREEILRVSYRTPFDLILRWLLKKKGLDFETIKKEDLNQLFEFSKNEEKVVEQFSLSDKNLLEKSILQGVSGEKPLETLSNKGLLIEEDKYVAFASLGFFELFQITHRPEDIFTELKYSMKRLEEEVDYKLKPSERNLVQLKNLVKVVNDEILCLEIGNRLGMISQDLIKNKYYQSALDVMEIARIALEKGGDIEKIADLTESMAKQFTKAENEYFAAKAFETAGEMFSRLGVKWRALSNYRDAGVRYRKVASEVDIGQHFMVRYLYEKSIYCMAKAEEIRRAEQFCSEAKKKLSDYPPHQSYFTTIEKKLVRGEIS